MLSKLMPNNRPDSRPFASFAGLLLALIAMTGCNDGRPARVPVSGRVLIDGEPLTQGYVRFVPGNDRPSTGQIGPDGRFTLGCFEADDGAVTGKHRVAVIANEAINESTMRWIAPEKYADYANSGIEVEITGPTDELEININGT